MSKRTMSNFENPRIENGIFFVGGARQGWDLRARLDTNGARICIVSAERGQICVDLNHDAARALANFLTHRINTD
jgi:hypothetical protein